MVNKAWKYRGAWPGIELANYSVTGGRLNHYTNSGALDIGRASQVFDLALTPNLGILRRLELD